MANLLAAQRHSIDNRAEVEASTLCGCFHCVHVFKPEEIVGWSGLDVSQLDDPDAAAGGTALCPRCGSDTVIGDKSGYEINPQFLARMSDAWLQRTVIYRPKPKA